ncbi:MAG: hypothetical protein Q4C85_08595 [Actinomyces sp.]|uniref:hypothetical protein n=1 Tax=Actinomyces sp. TaxID=29317 RepID=UPI0026DDABD5|nr:hypothetical protein [Actinomyces sp.]MDO4243796.1 hypothetical protein [Actinomyces sp.]
MKRTSARIPKFTRFVTAPAADLSAGAPSSTTEATTTDDSKPAWTPPASQDELNRIIGDRLARERAKYGDYKELKKKAAAFDEAAEASKSAEERAADRLAQAEARAAQAEAAAMRAEVAATKGVPVAFLTGSTREEADKAADALLAWRDSAAASRQTGALGPGARRARGSGSTEGVKGGGLAAGRAAFRALSGSPSPKSD